MYKNHKKLIQSLAAILFFSVICWLTYLFAPPATNGSPAWYSIVPPLLAVTLALLTNRILISLTVAVFAGGLLANLADWPHLFTWLQHGLTQGAWLLFHSVKDPGPLHFSSNMGILLYVTFIMSTIAVMLVAGGLHGIAEWLTRFARSARSTKLVTMAMGVAIFIDDYANTMIVGSTMRPVSDRHRISREKLAFLVDATAAPVAGIAVMTTWIGYEVGILGETAKSIGLDKNGYELFFAALGYQFYCLGLLAFLFFNSLFDRDYGPMDKAERRARRTGKLLDDGATPMTAQSLASAEPHATAQLQSIVAIVPMLALLGSFILGLWIDGGGIALLRDNPLAFVHLSVWRSIFSHADSIILLVYASGFSLVVASVMAVFKAKTPLGAIGQAIWTGVKSSRLPITVLILAWSLKGACTELQTGQFLADSLAGSISPMIFPALVFLVASVTSFATGTSYGTMGILYPTTIPIAYALDGGTLGLATLISIGAVLDGSIFGDHCSPISDTTIMSSTASACDHLAHVRTQMPYSLTVGGMAICFGYLPAALGMPRWIGLLAIAACFALLFFILWLRRSDD